MPWSSGVAIWVGFVRLWVLWEPCEVFSEGLAELWRLRGPCVLVAMLLDSSWGAFCCVWSREAGAGDAFCCATRCCCDLFWFPAAQQEFWCDFRTERTSARVMMVSSEPNLSRRARSMVWTEAIRCCWARLRAFTRVNAGEWMHQLLYINYANNNKLI